MALYANSHTERIRSPESTDVSLSYLDIEVAILACTEKHENTNNSGSETATEDEGGNASNT
jgi:hypothetical protein